MSPVLVGVIGLAVFLALLFLGVPIALSMMIVGICGSMLLLRQPFSAFGMASETIVGTFSSYTSLK